MKYLALRPSKRPKVLTAKLRCRTQHERLLAFLNANNPGGFQAEELQSLDKKTVGGMLEFVSQWNDVGYDRFKRVATQIKKVSGGVIKLHRAFDIVSVLFGYRNWQEAVRVFDHKQRLKNRRKAETISTIIYKPISKKSEISVSHTGEG